MDAPRSAHGHFKQNAFAWNSVFSQRRHDVYGSEDLRYVDSVRAGTVPHDRELMTEDVIGWFVQNQCNHDVDRYSYREGQLSNFLGLASLDALRNPAPSQIISQKALIDDRNNERVSRTFPNGDVVVCLSLLENRTLLHVVCRHLSYQQLGEIVESSKKP